ncbi:MAG: hypothetical protein KF791_08345 [Verrucomicrobiae bacterium]|nr:hypothetical protein [Verrucomicrobiae bacterium]
MATVVIESDTATPAIRRIAVNASGRRAHAAMAAAVAEQIRRHLVAKDRVPNQLGGRRTHFYAAAAQATHWLASERVGEVSISQDGIRQRLLGGTIRPIHARALTVPVHPLGHGRRAAEFGAELRLVPLDGGRDGHTSGLLVLGSGADAPVIYVLRAQVEQEADPSVLPTDEEMLREATSALGEIVMVGT